MPNLKGRYEHSQQKASDAPASPRIAAPYVPSVLVPCLGGCERMVPAGQKCVECATAAVDAWLASKRAKGRAK